MLAPRGRAAAAAAESLPLPTVGMSESASENANDGCGVNGKVREGEGVTAACRFFLRSGSSSSAATTASAGSAVSGPSSIVADGPWPWLRERPCGG